MHTPTRTTATARITSSKLPIIVIPGIMGSRLTDPQTDELVWNPMGMLKTEPGPFAARTARLSDVNAALVPDESHPFRCRVDREEVAPIKNFLHIVAAFYGNLVMALYYGLMRPLASRRITPALYCCGYDWRQDNRDSARRLAKVVEEARRECDGARPVLIAHSMGGLVSREYCHSLGGESSVPAVFLLGSPSLGTPSAYELLRTGLPPLDSVRRVLNLDRDGSRELMRSMQSAYQLLPNQVYCSAVRADWCTFDPAHTGYTDKASPSSKPERVLKFSDSSNSFVLYNDIYAGLREDPRTREVVREHITRAFAFHSGISVNNTAYMHPNTFVYYCEDIPTTVGMHVVFDGMGVHFGDYVVASHSVPRRAGGDKTVASDSANPGPVSAPLIERRSFSGVEHTALSSDNRVIDALLSRIASIV